MKHKIKKENQRRKLCSEDYANITKLYKILYYDSIGKACFIDNMPKTRKMFNTIYRDFSAVQLACLVFCHFEWYGPSGRQESDYTYIRDKRFPVELLVHNRLAYAAYCSEILGDRWTNDQELKMVLDIWIKRLMSVKKD